jgi:AraC-like DNA-binding protein
MEEHRRGAESPRSLAPSEGRRRVVSIRQIEVVLGMAVLRGVEAGPLLDAAGIALADLTDPDGRITHDQFEIVLLGAVRRTGDLDLGLHLGELMNHARLPEALHHALFASATLGDGYRRLTRFMGIIHGHAEIGLEVRGDVARLTHRLGIGSAEGLRHLGEWALSACFTRGRRCLGSRFSLREVAFAHEAPASTTEHERIFAAPVRFGQPVDALVFDHRFLDLSGASADPVLVRVLDAHLAQVAPPAPPPDFLLAVRRRIGEGLKGQCPPIASVAARLHMSPRSLQRRLTDLGTSYQALVCDVRRELAVRHLSEGALGIAEIAFVLGFSDVSTFHRAFKRSTGETPASFRAARRGGAAR